MQVNSVVTVPGVYVDIQEATGNVHKYARLEPYTWVWLSSTYANLNPELKISDLEDAYVASMQ